jgi:hypothetical protein
MKTVSMLTKHQMAALVTDKKKFLLSLSTKTSLNVSQQMEQTFFKMIFDYRGLKVTGEKFRL